MSVIWIATLKAKQGQGNAARTWLKRNTKRIAAAPGCQSVLTLIDPKNPDALLSVEVWDSRESHRIFMLSVFETDTSEERAILAEPPDGKYYEPI